MRNTWVNRIGIVALVGGLFLEGHAWGKAGDLLWQDEFDLGGTFDQARVIAAEGERVYVGGAGFQPPLPLQPPQGNSEDWLLRAYNGKSGKLLWQDSPMDLLSTDSVNAITVKKGRVYAAGTRQNDFFVKVYDGKTGKPLWQDLFKLGGVEDVAYAIAVDRGHVYVGGSGTIRRSNPERDGNTLYLLRAYDAKDGKLLWQDLFDTAVETQANRVNAITAEKGRVYVAGTRNGDYLVRAYDGDNGVLLWQDLVANAGVSAIDVERERVIAVGTQFLDSKGYFYVRAYDADSGGVLWQDWFDLGGGFNWASAVSIGDGRVYAVGGGANPISPFVSSDILVRAYDVRYGALLWQDHYHGAGNKGNFAVDVDLGGHTHSPAKEMRGVSVYIAGIVTATSALSNTEFAVRAYDGQTGKLLWKDEFDRAGGLDEALAIAVEKKRVYAAGFVSGDTNGNFFIRTYDAK